MPTEEADMAERLKDAERDVFNAEQYAVDLGKRIQLLEAVADAAKEFKEISEEWVPDVQKWDSHKKLVAALAAVATS